MARLAEAVRTRWRGLATAVILTLLVVDASFAHARSQSRIGEAYLAARAIGGLASVAIDGIATSSASRTQTDRTRLHTEAEPYVELYLGSDRIIPSPELRDHVSRAWLGFHVSDEISSLPTQSAAPAALSAVSRGKEAIAAFPEIAPFIEDPQGTARITDTAAVIRVLETAAVQETKDAASILHRDFPNLSEASFANAGSRTSTRP